MPDTFFLNHRFSPPEIDAVYRAIYERRDMRHFDPKPVDPAVLSRLFDAAHHAPSVGYMQPWRFIRITRPEVRGALQALVEEERQRTADALGEKGAAFMKLKVEGIDRCAELVVVALMEGREQHIFGRRTLPEMDLCSVACAIQNMWLAARAEGLGLGWVSLFDPHALAALLRMPEGAWPVAILCIGHVAAFYPEPMLEMEGWHTRQPLGEMIFFDAWNECTPAEQDKQAVQQDIRP